MSQQVAIRTAEREPSSAERVARLAQFDGEPATFLDSLLETQCRMAPAVAGALLAIEKTGATRVLASYPAPERGRNIAPWIVRALTLAPTALDATRTLPIPDVMDIDARVADPTLILVPAPAWNQRRLVTAHVVDGRPGALRQMQDRLELTTGLLGLHNVQVKVRAREDVIERLRTAMVVLETVNEHDRFLAAAMAMCNEVAGRWRGERVTLGFLDGRYVKTAAISHTERFDRKMRLVQDIESAQEECLDQDTEIIHPRRDASIYVSRATEQHSQRHGPLSIVSVPLRREGRAVGVLTLERGLDDPLGTEDVEILRVTCDLVLPRLIELRRRDRWIGARAASAAAGSLRGLLGPKHTGRKLASILGTALLLFAVLGRGEDRIDASFEITAIERRVVPAPFDGHVEHVAVEPGDVVEAGATVLATLDTADLQMQLAAAEAEHGSFLKEADLALRDELAVEVQIAEANLRRIEAEILLLEHRIDRATLVAPIDGTVVVGDLKGQLGAPVETGDVLFEVAQLDGLRAELAVPDDRIADLMSADGAWSDHRGELASVTDPGDRIPFEIELVNPVAEVIGNRNVFRVRVRLLEDRAWLRPGMKGVAKITIGQRPHVLLWTRSVVSWIRMTFWI